MHFKLSDDSVLLRFKISFSFYFYFKIEKHLLLTFRNYFLHKLDVESAEKMLLKKESGIMEISHLAEVCHFIHLFFPFFLLE